MTGSDGAGIHDALPQFTHAFQPIVDVTTCTVFAYEALIRGVENTPAHAVLHGLEQERLYSLDRKSRLSALDLAHRIGTSASLSLNALPASMGDENEKAHGLLVQATACGFSPRRIIVEVTEYEVIADLKGFQSITNDYRRNGFQLAIDDFGAGHSGLNLLADFQPDIIKLDMNLVRNIERRGPRQSIARAIMQVCEDLGIDVIAEGVETLDEYEWFAAQGVRLFQGYLFAKPGFESFPSAQIPGMQIQAHGTA